jgi:serine/threonine-protein kinase
VVTPAPSSRHFLAPGDKLGKYEVIRQIAVGGMAELYLTRTVGIEGFEKLVCVKRILPQYINNPTFVNMFLNEARLAAMLHHPNIAQVYDIGQDAGEYFFSMEYVHGEDLGRLVATGRENGVPISLDCALTLAAGLCAGLHHAHEKAAPDGKPLGVVHRDVSPTNVLVSYDGAVKLVDFGIARAGGEPSQSTTGLKGKISYMSPEQCRGRTVLDRRSDVFSVGSILYELTTGRLPFVDETEYGVLHQIVNREADPPSTLVPGFPPQLEAIVMRALAREPERRFSTALELQNQLEDYAHENRLRVSPLVLARLMSTLFPARLEEWDHARAQGAFFVEQHVVRTLIESGKTADGAPRYQPQPQPQADDASDGVTSVAGSPTATDIQAMQPMAIGPTPRLARPPSPSPTSGEATPSARPSSSPSSTGGSHPGRPASSPPSSAGPTPSARPSPPPASIGGSHPGRPASSPSPSSTGGSHPAPPSTNAGPQPRQSSPSLAPSRPSSQSIVSGVPSRLSSPSLAPGGPPPSSAGADPVAQPPSAGPLPRSAQPLATPAMPMPPPPAGSQPMVPGQPLPTPPPMAAWQPVPTPPPMVPGQPVPTPPPMAAGQPLPTPQPFLQSPGGPSSGRSAPGRSSPVPNHPGAVPIVMPLPAPPVPSGGTLVSSATQAGNPPPAVKPVVGPYGATGLGGLAAQSVQGYPGPGGSGSFAGQPMQVSFGSPEAVGGGMQGQGSGAFGPIYTGDVTDRVRVSNAYPTQMLRHSSRRRLPIAALVIVGVAGALTGVWLAVGRDGSSSATEPAAPSAIAPPPGEAPKPSAEPAVVPAIAGEPGKVAAPPAMAADPTKAAEPGKVADPPAMAGDPTKAAEPGKVAQPPTMAADPAKPAEPKNPAAPVKVAEPPVKVAEPPVKVAEPPVKPAERGKPAEAPVKVAEPLVKPAERGKPAGPPARTDKLAADPSDDPTKAKSAKVVVQDPHPKAAKPRGRTDPKRADKRPRKAEPKEPTWNADSPFLPETTPKR